MFTGIITDIGTIASLKKTGDTLFVIETSYDLSTVDLGASIACSGVCLTVIKKNKNSFEVEASDETLNCTTASSWVMGKKINLERALKIGDELGGHIVSGHVDGLAQVVSINKIGDSHEVIFSAPDDLKYFIAAKGSVTLDGVSLTVNSVDNNNFSINIIPHTWNNTIFNSLSAADKVNLEIDTMARYVARLNESK